MSQKLSDKLAASVRGVKQASESISTEETAITPKAKVAKEIETKMVTPVFSAKRVWPD